MTELWQAWLVRIRARCVMAFSAASSAICTKQTSHLISPKHGMQGGQARGHLSQLGGQALVPDMLYPLLNAFNPSNAHVPVAGAQCNPQLAAAPGSVQLLSWSSLNAQCLCSPIPLPSSQQSCCHLHIMLPPARASS